MKKSILAMLLAAVMVLSLTACGEAAPSSSEVVESSSEVVEESSEVVEESSEVVEESSEAVEESSEVVEESSEAVEESSEAVEESSEAAEESSEAAEESSEAAEETPVAADSTHSGKGYTIKLLGDHKASQESGVDLFFPVTANGNNYAAALLDAKAYSTTAEFLGFTKEVLDPTMTYLVPGFQGSILSHKFSKISGKNAIEMSFKRTVDGVTYNEYFIWVDIEGGGLYQFEFFSKDGDPAQIYADVIASINVA
ncbi:MAG: hypothetical protein IJC83_03200 [Oscillospiraceae bacterium]|nr:hypothetical protein [Oscillospiraceae bacterium]